MEQQEAYHLSWESFQTNLSSTLGGLQQGNLADVTLVSEDQIQMQAHRIVLSACSPVLKNLLLCNPSSHPLIHLMGAKQQDIQSILQFMYLGEAAVNKEHIDDVIEIAKDLQMEEILHYYTKGESIENIKEDKEVSVNGRQVNDDLNSIEYNTCGDSQDIIKGLDKEKIGHITAADVVKIKAETVDVNFVESINETKCIKLKGSRSIKCDDCELVFITRMGLRLHRRSIHEGIRYFCDYCDFQATTQGHLKIHRQSKHEGILYSCNNCEYQTKRQDSLKIHQQFKHEGVQYSCNLCDFHVARQYSLNRHQQTKHKGMVYSCSECDYQSGRKESLKNHQQTKHEGIRYSCDKCEYKATQRRHLKEHQQSKHEGVLYACKHCDYKAPRKDSLKAHEQSKHEGLRYSCDKCDYQAISSNILKRHQESVHEGIKHYCKECDFQTSHRGDLKKHQLLCHKVIKEEQFKQE